MMRSLAWFDRQLAHARACLAQIDGAASLQQTQLAHYTLSQAYQPQPDLFTAPPYAGLIPGGQPELPGWRIAAIGS